MDNSARSIKKASLYTDIVQIFVIHEYQLTYKLYPSASSKPQRAMEKTLSAILVSMLHLPHLAQILPFSKHRSTANSVIAIPTAVENLEKNTMIRHSLGIYST